MMIPRVQKIPNVIKLFDPCFYHLIKNFISNWKYSTEELLRERSRTGMPQK